MRKSLFWIISFFITALFAVFQRVTGPTYPVAGSLATPGGVKVSYRLPRSCTIGENNCGTRIKADRPLTVFMEWRRYKTEGALCAAHFTVPGTAAVLPDEPPAGKLEYSVYAIEGGARVPIGPQKVVVRFKGAVPAGVLVPHVLFVFAFMLFSVRIALSALMNKPVLKHTVFFNLFFLVLGGFIFGPVTQYYAFGAYWTGIPFGHDLTDNKTLLPLFFWAASAVSAMRGGANLRRWVIAAFLATAAVYFIPHSVFSGNSPKAAGNSVI